MSVDKMVLFHAYSGERISIWAQGIEEAAKKSGLKVLTISDGIDDLYRHDDSCVDNTFGFVQSKNGNRPLYVEFTIGKSTEVFRCKIKYHQEIYGPELLNEAFEEFVLKVKKEESVIKDEAVGDPGFELGSEWDVVENGPASGDSKHHLTSEHE